jgi:hypothetical protein
MTDRKDKKRRLERAGFTLWLAILVLSACTPQAFEQGLEDALMTPEEKCAEARSLYATFEAPGAYEQGLVLAACGGAILG